MKTCPSCRRTYTDASLNFCLEDGSPLVSSAAPGIDPNATIRYTDPRDTKSPTADAYRAPVAPAVYDVADPVAHHGSQFGQQQQSNLSAPGAQRKKSNAVWWILGGVVVVGIIVVGAAIMIIAIASMATNSNRNMNANSNRAIASSKNRNANTSTTNVNNENSNANLPASLTDDFSEAKWGTGTYPFGEIWYADEQYHMRAKDKTYLVMYAPSPDYKTGNATVKVTARSVDGTSPASGYGLIVHGEKSKSGDLEDYALLIFTGAEPKYEIIKHKSGTQTTLVPWAKSSIIRTGTNPNQLEVRASGSELSFYINGQYVNRITDDENFKGGIAGLYTSDTAEVSFDDLEIKR
jgi:cytoskeletal protein RodZ